MNAKGLYFTVAAGLFGWSLANASVTGVTDWNYSGAIYCYSPLWDSTGNIGIEGYQSGPAQMSGTITTSDPQDPTLTIANTIDNDSAFPWTGYIVNVSMGTSFTILSANVTAPPGWTASITQPGAPVAGIYTGTINYVGGIPVAVAPASNSELDFAYQVMFSGSTSYSLTESVTPVPEPVTFGLLALGGLLLGVKALGSCRHSKQSTAV
ncbi:MAG TPA: hypothetical protein VMJ12_18210 [Candidatus Acidoferrales bacterium]|nr:hypothetical protein [Candidatus Acidoferrales bacterium]